MTNQNVYSRGGRGTRRVLRSRRLGPAAAILLFAAGIGPVRGAEPRYLPDPAVTGIAATEDPMSLEDLIRISLVASGLPEEGLEDGVSMMTDIASSVPDASGDHGEDAEALLEWMHRNHLTRYVENQTRLDVLLRDGTYNCVSSAVFYVILARRSGIPVHGVLTTDHAFCRIPPTDGQEGFDVETTTPYGFDPGTRREAVESFSGRTGFTYVPPGNYRRRRDIGERELVSLIYQNRISMMQRRGDWAGTVGLARDRWELSGTDAAREDFRTSLTNYAAEMDRRRLYEEGLRFLGEAAGELGEGHGLDEAASALLGNGVTRHLRAGRIEEARALLDDGELTALVPAGFAASRRNDIDRAELDAVVSSGDFETALAEADAALESGLIDRARWDEIMLYLWSNEARGISSGGNWLQGWEFLRAAPGKLSSIPRWDELVESYRGNAAVAFHNRFAAAFRRNRLEEAAAVLDEAQALFPEDGTLQRDRGLLESRTGGD